MELADLPRMGEAIAGARLWVLQQFVPRHAMSESLRALSPHPPERIRAFADLVVPYAERIALRGL